MVVMVVKEVRVSSLSRILSAIHKKVTKMYYSKCVWKFVGTTQPHNIRVQYDEARA